MFPSSHDTAFPCSPRALLIIGHTIHLMLNGIGIHSNISLEAVFYQIKVMCFWLAWDVHGLPWVSTKLLAVVVGRVWRVWGFSAGFALFFRWIGFESHSFSLTCVYNQRDFPAQDTMHALLSLNFVSLSFIVVPVNLNGSRRLNCLMHTMKLSKQIAYFMHMLNETNIKQI